METEHIPNTLFHLMLSKLQNTDANMFKAVATFLVFALLCNNARAFSNIAADCCLSTTETLIPRRIAESYIIQTTDSGCPIPATVFITKKNRKLCSPPVTDLKYPWVLKLVEFLDTRNSKKNGAQ